MTASAWLRAHADDEYAYLTTTGRRTGRPHEIEIWFGVVADAAYLLSGAGERSDWVRNLRADPAVRLRLGDEERPATAAVAAEGPRQATARRLLAAKYQGWRPGDALSRWAATALAVVVTAVDG